MTNHDLMATMLASLAAALVSLWGLAHTIPTSQVLAGFNPITQDNRRVVLQEWLAEAFTMWGLAGIIVAVTIVGGAGSHASQWVYPRGCCSTVCLGRADRPYRCPHASDLVQDLPRPADFLRSATGGGESGLTTT